jgi:hypothetical protein
VYDGDVTATGTMLMAVALMHFAGLLCNVVASFFGKLVGVLRTSPTPSAVFRG